MRKKLLSLLVLLMVAVTGAWAQEETLLTTITPTGDGTYSETTAGAVTVTPAGSFFYSGSSYGWRWDSYGSLTVTANEGYTITRCVFIQQGKNQSVTISEAPFALNFEEWLCLENYSMDGVSSIEVYGYVTPTATQYAVTLADGTEDAANWTIDPATAEEGQTVTITYAGTKSVMSVTAKRKTATGNITVYFTDALDYGDVHVYYWPDGVDWPGTAMTYVETNGYSQKIYKAVIPATPEGVIFNGNGRQTVDITANLADGSWWYTTDNNDVGYVGKYTENIEVTNVDDNKWTFTMPDCDVELEVEYKDAATGIESIDHEPLTIDHWYDLNGRKIQTPKQRGIYINNGKKVVIK